MKDQAQKKFAQAPKPAKLGKSEPHARAEIARLERAVAAKLAATAAATRALRPRQQIQSADFK